MARVQVTLLLQIFFVVEIFLSVLTSAEKIENDESTVLDLCESPVYCDGDLLKTVQLAAIFRDSKTFVDLSQKNDEGVTLANFKKLMKTTKNNPSKDEISKFVSENFQDKNELLEVPLGDWTPKPKILNKIKDPNYRKWVSDLNEIWKTLARRTSGDVKTHPKRHSLIYVNNTFIIPGGRFKEFYYWDTYWVIEGLLLNGMSETTKGIIENFLSLVKTYGFIPNGGRIYYLNRSQPPLLIPMIDKYYEATKDWNFVDENLPALEKEFKFWQRYHTIEISKNGRQYTLARYFSNSKGPRPESYREDYLLAENIKNPEKKEALYHNIKAGAESGWDFSTRWFIGRYGEPSLDLHDIMTEDIIPVDLNAFLERNARILARFYKKKNNSAKVKTYTEIAEKLREALKEVFWNEVDGTWYDYELKNSRSRATFYPSNLTPLYTMSYDESSATEYGNRSVQYLKANAIPDFKGGIPTSLIKSGQQWDFTNAWAPLQSIIVHGLRKTNFAPAMDVARDLAEIWLHSNYLGFTRTKKMYEKYNSMKSGKSGGGGEYNVQDGFGWTNGVVIDFLDTYPSSEYKSKDCEQNTKYIIIHDRVDKRKYGWPSFFWRSWESAIYKKFKNALHMHF